MVPSNEGIFPTVFMKFINFEQNFPQSLHTNGSPHYHQDRSVSLGLVVIIHINPHNFPGILPLRRHEIKIGLHVLRRPVLSLVHSSRKRERVAVHAALGITPSGPLQRPGVPHVRGDPRGPALGPLDVARDLGLRRQGVAWTAAAILAVHLLLLLLFLGFEGVERVVRVGGGVVFPGGVRD